MGFTVRLAELEAFLDDHARAWQCATDVEWRRVAAQWEQVFRGPVERQEQHQAGVRACEHFASRLPADVLILSGLAIPEVGNVACQGAALYRVAGLVELDLQLAGRCEVVVIGAEFDWCLLTSHETALAAAHELFFARDGGRVD